MHISRQTVTKKSFRGAASVTKMPVFDVTLVMEICTATAASGSMKCINYRNKEKKPNFRLMIDFCMEALTAHKKTRSLSFGMHTMTQINCRQAAALLLSSMNIKYLVWWIINPCFIMSPGKAMINMIGRSIAPLTTLRQRRRGRHDSEAKLQVIGRVRPAITLRLVH